MYDPCVMDSVENQETIESKFNNASRIVVKVGSALVVDEGALRPNREWLESLAYDIQRLCEQGKEVILVASGAVALGKERAGLVDKVDPTPRDKRLASTIGARKHANAIAGAFSVADVEAEYVVVTPTELLDDHASKKFYITVSDLMGLGILPVVNENDTVADDELKVGNNDALAASVGNLMKADFMVILTDVDGLYMSDPKKNPDAELIKRVDCIDDDILAMATAATSKNSTGGMIVKVKAANDFNGDTIIANGTMNNPLSRLQEVQRGTCFFKKQMG